MSTVENNTVDLILTSPPYPMIEMWDESFSEQNLPIKKYLDEQNGIRAFELMNEELNKVWKEVYRVLKPGGIVCINIGDATRTLGNTFQLYPSHAEIITSCRKLGFSSLPEIIWKKQTNAPNKFMGSGMLPSGAYVTLEHEYILVFRKGGKREFYDEDTRLLRQQSAYFWEERNIWFSDIWDIKGTTQQLNDNHTRKRSAAYPFELAYRLINMFSIKNDLVLDPFLGTGTTSVAALASGRNSIGYEMDKTLFQIIEQRLTESVGFSNECIKKRIKNHILFMSKWIEEKGNPKYINRNYNFPVITNQETAIIFHFLDKISKKEGYEFEALYKEVTSTDIEITTTQEDKTTNLNEETKNNPKDGQNLHQWL